MFKNYLTVAIRNLIRHKVYSTINIAGLAAGMACAMLILLWVQDELSYDRFHEKADRIYRLVAEGNNGRYAISHAPLGDALKDECPEVVLATRVDIGAGRSLVGYAGRRFEQRGKTVDSDFLRIFTHHFVEGDAETALSRPDAIVLTQDLAGKLFGSENPIGKTVNVDNRRDFEVRGVIENVPHNAHLQFDFLVRWRETSANWGDWSYYTYVLLKDGSSVEQVTQEVNDCYRRRKLAAESEMKPVSLPTYSLQPLTRIHLHSGFRWDVEENGDVQYVYISASIAGLILLIACINFMNLATARSANRAREVGVRKVVGSSRMQIARQFLGESVLLAFLACMVALLLVEQALPFFGALSGKALSLDYLDYRFILGAAAMIVITGVLAGSYPALFLSAFDPVKVFKGTVTAGAGGRVFRTVLVVAQFSASIGLMIGTTVIADQIAFMRHAKLGFDKENLIYLALRGGARSKVGILKAELLQHPDILNATASSRPPAGLLDGTTGAWWEGKEEGANVQMQILRVDHDFLDTYGMQMAEGRFYARAFVTDAKEGIVLNEAAVRAMEMQSPLGKQFRFLGDRRIIGVVKDFHYRPLREVVEPLIMRLSEERINCLALRIRPVHSRMSDLTQFLEEKWKAYSPEYPFECHFLDERIDRLYAAEQRLSRVLGYFTYLAIFIACLGLFGLVSFTAERRTREIGVRKVLGASVTGIVFMLTREFAQWVVAANLIAWPIAYVVMDGWLQDFAYRIPIGWWPFMIAGVAALGVSLLTVSYQAVRAATANPVDVLRHE